MLNDQFPIFLLVRRSLRQHALSTVVTVLSVALASGLVMAVFAIKAQTYQAFTGGAIGFDAVLGARGSQLQLILNTIFHLETSPGNLSWEMYQTIAKDPRVELAIPYAVGDSYEGFRIVGTSEEVFTKFEYQRGRKFQAQAGGRFFTTGQREAVLGSYVAQQTGLQTGATFQPIHGVMNDPRLKHKEQYTVIGVLEPTNSPSDRVIWIPLEGIYRMSGHILRGSGESFRAQEGEAIPDEHKEVSAVMLKLRDPQAGFQLDQQINKQGKVATLAWPIARVMGELFDKLGWVNRVLELVAYLVIAVAAGSILASIYNSINERRREFAILRALGARRLTVFSAIVLEAATITLFGTLVGYGAYAAILLVTRFVVKAQTGVVLEAFHCDNILFLAPMLLIVIGALAGLIPALKAYRTDVAEHLTPLS